MNKQAIYHMPKSNYCYAYNENTVHIRLRAAKNDLDRAILIYGDKYEWGNHKEIEMELTCSDELFDYFTVAIEPPNKRLSYIFIVISNKEAYYFTEWGLLEEIDEKEIHQYFFNYPYINEADIHKVPEWVKDAVFYQIFPERFYNGDPSNDPQNIEKWGELPERSSFYGGDLKGILDKIDYLGELGITALYLTPIFESTTNHKYNTKDYLKIDSHFGDLDTMKKLVEKCHEKGIKVILDAVFNHSGNDFKPFKDVARRGKESPYYNWFHIYRWPLETNPPSYETFAFEPRMPKLNTVNPEVRNYLFDVVRYWMKETDIDGWRLDVANEIDHHFWRGFREVVKEIKEDAYIVGEIWHDSLPWLMGDQMDAIMNYPFRRACVEYFAYKRVDSEDFKQIINKTLMRNTWQVNEVMFNLLDSHDTARFLFKSDEDVNRLMLASVFQLTFIGTPCIYYGTEIGISGGDDPDCRRTMEWNSEKWDIKLLNHYKMLIKLRKEHEALRRGSFKWIDGINPVVGYIRETEGEKIIVLINNSDKDEYVTVTIKGNISIDLINKEKIRIIDEKLEISVPSNSFRMFLIEKIV